MRTLCRNNKRNAKNVNESNLVATKKKKKNSKVCGNAETQFYLRLEMQMHTKYCAVMHSLVKKVKVN